MSEKTAGIGDQKGLRRFTPGEGGNWTLTVMLEGLRPDATGELRVRAYPFHAVLANGDLLGSDEFAFLDTYRLKASKGGSLKLEILLVCPDDPGWLEAGGFIDGLDLVLQDWKWEIGDEYGQANLTVPIRGTAAEPWDGNGQEYQALPVADIHPRAVVREIPFEGAPMFPGGSALTIYRAGDKVPLEDGITFDFGLETIGFLEIEIHCPAERRLRIVTAESYDSLDSDPWWHGANTFQLKRGKNRIVDPFRKGFRYARLELNKPARATISSIHNRRPGQPLPGRGFFRCSDPLINRIHEVSLHTVSLCTQKFLEDGIRRDRLLWTGDLYPMADVMYLQLGGAKLVREGLVSFARHINADGIIQPSFPWRTGWVMADYVMWWILALADYCRQTDDLSILGEVKDTLRRQEKWLSKRVSPDGLFLAEQENGAPITCWSSRKREGFPFYHTALWNRTRGALLELRRLAGSGKIRVPGNRERADRELWNEWVFKICRDRNGLWRDLDRNGSVLPAISHDSSVMALKGRVAPALLKSWEKGKKQKPVYSKTLEGLSSRLWTDKGAPVWSQDTEMEKTQEESNRIMPLFNAYEAEERIRLGDWDGGRELLARCFGYMLAQGATSFWESFGLDGSPWHAGKGFTSLCHGWSGYPAAIFPKILGADGVLGRRIWLLPSSALFSLEYAETAIPWGEEILYLKSEWDESARTLSYSGVIPEDAEGAIVELPLLPDQIKSIETEDCKLDTGDNLSVVRVKPGESFRFQMKVRKRTLKALEGL